MSLEVQIQKEMLAVGNDIVFRLLSPGTRGRTLGEVELERELAVVFTVHPSVFNRDSTWRQRLERGVYPFWRDLHLASRSRGGSWSFTNEFFALYEMLTGGRPLGEWLMKWRSIRNGYAARFQAAEGGEGLLGQANG